MTPPAIKKLTPTDSALHAQFFAMLQKEFTEIPWLTENAVAKGETYALVENDGLVGGMMLFEHSPETDNIRKEAERKLNGRPAVFASCFTVVPEHREKGYGLFLAKNILQREVFEKGKVAWGVFQKPSLADFYKKHFVRELYPLPSNLHLIIFAGGDGELGPRTRKFINDIPAP